MADDVGATFGPEPCATLKADAHELRLEGTRGQFRIARDAIRRIGRGGVYPWFFRSIHISHTISKMPHNLQFKPLGVERREIVAKLKELGYPV